MKPTLVFLETPTGTTATLMKLPEAPIAPRSVKRFNVKFKHHDRLYVRKPEDSDPSNRDDHRAAVRDRQKSALQRSDNGRNRKLYHQIMAGEL